MFIPSTYSIRSGKYLLKCKGLTSYCTLEERDIVHDVFKVIIGMLHTYLCSFEKRVAAFAQLIPSHFQTRIMDAFNPSLA